MNAFGGSFGKACIRAINITALIEVFSRFYKEDMLMKFLFYLLALTLALLTSCGGKSGVDIVDEISGVWRVQDGSGLVTIIYTSKKTSLFIDEKEIPVALGNIDNENKTVNFNVSLQDNKTGILTLQQIWNKDNKGFYLKTTMPDASQFNLNFVRKVSIDDLNKIAKAKVIDNSSATQTEIMQDSKNIDLNVNTNESSRNPNADAIVGLPQFKQDEDYASIRNEMIRLGWNPFHSENADTCSDGDTRCQGRPEMEACAGTGMANCKFIWEKNNKKVAICTIGEDAVFDGICSP